MTAEEFYKSKSKKFPEVNTIIEWLEEYGKQQYNQAIDDAAENAEVKKIESPHGEWLDEYVIDEESILKLKKK